MVVKTRFIKISDDFSKQERQTFVFKNIPPTPLGLNRVFKSSLNTYRGTELIDFDIIAFK